MNVLLCVRSVSGKGYQPLPASMNHLSGLTNIHLLCLWTIQLRSVIFTSSPRCPSLPTEHYPDTVWWRNLMGCAGSGLTTVRFVGSCVQQWTLVCLWHSPGVPPTYANFLARRRPKNQERIYINVQGLSPSHSSFIMSFCCCMLGWPSSWWIFPPHPPVLEVPHQTSPWESW